MSDEEDDVRPLEASKETEMENLTKRLLSLRKERRKLEKELESTIEEYFPPLSDGPGKDEAEAALVEVKKLYYERMGVKVTVNKTAKDGKMFEASLLNWFDGKVVLKYYIMGNFSKKYYIFREHNIPKKVCTSLDEFKLPLRVSIEEGKAILSSLFKSVSAFFERKNQFQEVNNQTSYNLQSTWSGNCQEIQIKSPLSCIVTDKSKNKSEKDVNIMFVLKYEEKKVLPTTVDAYLLTDGDDGSLETHVKPKLQLFLTDYLLNAFQTLFGDDLNSAVDDEEEST